MRALDEASESVSVFCSASFCKCFRLTATYAVNVPSVLLVLRVCARSRTYLLVQVRVCFSVRVRVFALFYFFRCLHFVYLPPAALSPQQLGGA